MSYDQKLMDRCISHALANPIKSRGRTSISRMAALLANENHKYQFSGWNKYKTHPLMYQFSKDHNKICLHAEIDVLLQLIGWTGQYTGVLNLTNWDIYVARVLKDGTPALAKPCDTCMGALNYFGIRNIYHT